MKEEALSDQFESTEEAYAAGYQKRQEDEAQERELTLAKVRDMSQEEINERWSDVSQALARGEVSRGE